MIETIKEFERYHEEGVKSFEFHECYKAYRLAQELETNYLVFESILEDDVEEIVRILKELNIKKIIISAWQKNPLDILSILQVYGYYPDRMVRLDWFGKDAPISVSGILVSDETPIDTEESDL